MRLDIRLSHAPIRDGAAKGKIERFFRGFRDRFIVYFDGKRMGEAQLLQLHANAHLITKENPNKKGGIYPLSDQRLEVYIQSELDAVRMGANTFDAVATELIIRSVQGNLRLYRNLCYGSLVEDCRENKKIVTISHVNHVLVQPHWRSHEELIEQQAN